MLSRKLAAMVLLLPIGLAGCIDLDLNFLDSLFPEGTEYVVRGTAAIIEDGGPCRVWFGEDGVIYYLFQDRQLESDLFDQVVAPGATSRIVVSTRSDLQAPCGVDAIVEVKDVLEIVGM